MPKSQFFLSISSRTLSKKHLITETTIDRKLGTDNKKRNSDKKTKH